jgi:adenosyl cobinamide kinase/adenosyl cobinamide phosphate guanylyltransferase
MTANNSLPNPSLHSSAPLLGLVGPCTAGKSTIGRLLQAEGKRVKHIAQEHSFVPDMWKRIAKPDILLFLDVSFEISQQRRPMNWRLQDYAEQQRRLSHARQHADFYILTDSLTPQETLQAILSFLRESDA